MRRSCIALLCFLAAAAISAGAQKDQSPPHVVVTAEPAFSRISSRDEGMEINFFYQYYPLAYLQDPPATYMCDYETMTYVIVTPNGARHSLNLVDKKKEAGLLTSAFFGLHDYKIFDSVGVWPGLRNERRFYWKQAKAHPFNIPGRYRIVETGIFRDTKGKLPDLSFRSSEAVCIVDPNVAPLRELKDKAQEIVQKRFDSPIRRVLWSVSEEQSGDRSVSGLVKSNTIPEDQIPPEERRKGKGIYGGVHFNFVFSPEGQLKSQEMKPNYRLFD
jgi:hypothetical protein